MTPLDKFQHGFWGLLLLSVVALGAVIEQDLLRPPKDTGEEAKNARAPASLPAMAVSLIPQRIFQGSNTTELPLVSILDVGCLNSLAPIHQTQGPLVRIRGQICRDLSAENFFNVQNETNGFIASFFRPDPLQTQFTTDYIHLSPGKNNIVFRRPLQAKPVGSFQIVYNAPLAPTPNPGSPLDP